MLHYLCQTFFTSIVKRHLWLSWEIASEEVTLELVYTEQMLTNPALRIGVLFFT